MTWILFAVGGHFLYALTAVMDKFLLDRRIPSPAAYTFYVGLLSVFSVILLPFGFEWNSWENFTAELALGGIFLVAVYAYISVIKNEEVSRFATLIGGMTPIFTLWLSALILGEKLTQTQVLAFLLLFFGGILIAVKFDGLNLKAEHGKNFWMTMGLSFLAAFLFALYYVMAKNVFADQNFISSFAFSRFGSFLIALLFLLVPDYRREIFSARQSVGVKGGALFVVNKISGALSFIFINYAVQLGSVTLVNALQGIQFVFLLGLVFLLSRGFPEILREDLEKKVLAQKITAVVLIISGLVFLYI